MKRIWKVLGTIGGFLAGYFSGNIVLSFLPLHYLTNEREITVAFSVLIGLIVANWWYKNSDKMK